MSQEDKCTETLEGDKIGCIYSVMIKMATTTNVQETTEDRRRQKDGRILKKNLPDENSYKQVLIKLGRFPARPDLNEAILEPDDLDDLDE